MEELLKSPWALAAYFAAVVAYGAWSNRGFLAAQGKRLVAMVPGRTATAAKASDSEKLAALKLLCGHYKGDPEGHAALQVLKARFLLVPGAAE